MKSEVAKYKALRAGDVLRPGDEIEVGYDGLAKLAYADGTQMELQRNTRLRVTLGEGMSRDAKRLALDRGKLLCAAAPQKKPFEILTPSGLATIVGTRFSLVVSGAKTALAVTEGQVQLERDGQSLLVGAGQTATASDQGLKMLPPVAPTVSSANLIPNPGFESGTSPWRYHGASRLTGEAYAGSYCGKATGTVVGIWQTITGLKPNTTYVMRAWGRIGTAGEEAFIYAKYYGGTEQRGVFTTTTYTQQTLAITTGATNTSVEVGLWKYVGPGSAWVDAFELRPQSSPAFANTPGRGAGATDK